MRISSRLRTCASVSPSPSRARPPPAPGPRCGRPRPSLRSRRGAWCVVLLRPHQRSGAVRCRRPRPSGCVARTTRDRLRTRPDRAAAQAGQVRLRLRARGADEHGTVDARRRHLLRGLAAVAAVGDEREVVTADDCPSVGAGEAGEPAQVGEVAHQEGVDVREPGPHPDDSIGDGHAAASLRATASTAST
jgi:hypothetical protein